MSTWTAAAREELERYFGKVKPGLAASGADAGEVIDDLRRHLEQEIASARLQVVTEGDVRRLLARIGAPEPDPGGGESPAAVSSSPSPEPSELRAPGVVAKVLIIGVGIILPAISLVLEWLTGMCAGAFFDPLPTPWHVVLVALVPCTNALLWRALTGSHSTWRSWLGWAGGAAVGIETYYALVFLPLLLPGLFAVIFFGWGLLPLSPILSVIATLYLMRQVRLRLPPEPAQPRGASLRGVWPGFGLGAAVLVLLSVPDALTRYALALTTEDEPVTARRGIALLRTWGDPASLLRECYGRTRGAESMDLVGWLVTGGRRVQAEQAREMYYRVTGRPFNSVPAPQVRTGRARWAGLDDWTWDRDQAGQQVGGRIRGLTLHSSRLDALVEPDAALAYYEWTLEFRNAGVRQREARAQVLLPPGGVVSRLTLWVNGEEREAAFAGRSQVRQAYGTIVRRQQDPVLVTTCGPDRVLVQCFPVPADGGLMKIRLGITAPLALNSPDRAVLRWPQLIERNFTVFEDFRHSVWVEGPQPLTSPGGLFRTEQPKPGWHAARGEARETDLGAARSFLDIARDSAMREVWTRDSRGEAPGIVRQILQPAAASQVSRVVIVLDGSLTMQEHFPEVSAALAAVPAALECRLIVARDEPVLLEGGAASAETRQRLARWPAQGGQDNVPALVQAWDLASEKPGGVVLWIHGPVPVLLGSVEALRQRFERRPDGPRLLELQTEAGPNRILEKLDGVLAADSWPRTADLAGDMKALFGVWSGANARFEWVRQRTAGLPTAAPAGAEASLHLARLWAREEIVRLMTSRKVAAAVDLAGRYQLVTPVSGAVVLETAQQYQANGLEPVPPSSVPSIPEPQTWAMLVFGTVFLALVLRSRTPGRRTRSP